MKKRLTIPKAKTITGPALIWKRILAFVIDLFIFDLIVVTFFRNTMMRLIPQTKSFTGIQSYLMNNPSIIGTLTWLIFILAFLAIIYFVYQEYKFGDTFGKKLLKIYVQSDTKQLKLWQCLVRNLYWVPIFPIFPLLAIADFLSMFFNKNNQRLSEQISKTRTVSIYVMDY